MPARSPTGQHGRTPDDGPEVALHHRERRWIAARLEEGAHEEVGEAVAHVVGGVALVEPAAPAAVPPPLGAVVAEGDVEQSADAPAVKLGLDRVDLVPSLPLLEG